MRHHRKSRKRWFLPLHQSLPLEPRRLGTERLTVRFFRTGARMVTLDEWSTTTRTEDDRDWVGFTFFKLVDLQEEEQSQRVESHRASSTRQEVASLFPVGGLFDDPAGLMNQQNPERQFTNEERNALIVDNENYMTNHPKQDAGRVEEPVNPRITTCEVAEPVRPRITTYGVAEPVNPKITTSGESRGPWTVAGASSSSGLHGRGLQEDGMQRALVPSTRPYKTIDGKIELPRTSTTTNNAVATSQSYDEEDSIDSDGSFEKVTQ